MRVLGVDPGTRITGWGIIDVSGSRLTRVASGVLRLGSGELSGRLAAIYAAISSIISEHDPTAASLERNFVARNVQSALRLGEARGAIMAAVAGRSVALTEYTPATIKKAVVGHGRAGKADIQQTMVRLLGLAELPTEDEADALAVAACYALRSAYDGKISESLGGPIGAKTPRPVHRSRGLSEVAKGVLAKRTKRLRND